MTRIIAATEDDWARVREIRLRSLSTDPSAFGTTWSEESSYSESTWRARMNDAQWFVAVEDETPVGVIAVSDEDDTAEGELELQAMWVSSDYRRQGTATDLVKAVVDWAAKEGAKAVILWVGPESTAAQKVYLASDFADSGERYEVDPDDPRASWLKMTHPLDS